MVIGLGLPVLCCTILFGTPIEGGTMRRVGLDPTRMVPDELHLTRRPKPGDIYIYYVYILYIRFWAILYIAAVEMIVDALPYPKDLGTEIGTSTGVVNCSSNEL